MKLSAPVYQLKSKAKKLKKEKNISLHEALDRIAQQEGFNSWSLLQAKAKDIFPKTKEEILGYLNPGDLLLLAGRPGQRKTTYALQILVQAANEKRSSYFFSLEYTHRDVAQKVSEIDDLIGSNHEFVHFDFSDEICSRYIEDQIRGKVKELDLIVIDYLQILDHRRSNPALLDQVASLKRFAKEKGCVMIFISQIDRSYELKGKGKPSLDDIRLPNPLDLKLFNKTIFLHDGGEKFSQPDSVQVD